MNLVPLMRRHLAALRALLVLTAITGIAYPLVVLGVAQAVVHDKANGSLVEKDGKVVGSKLIGQYYNDADGNPDLRYFQGRPSAAGDGYDPTSTAASNLGPEDIVDTLATPDDPDSGSQSLLTQVCARSKEIGEREGVNGLRPFCTTDGVGAVVAVFPATAYNPGSPNRVVSLNQACPARPFLDTYLGVKVECAQPGEDYSAGRVEPIRHATTDPHADRPQVPADAVAASGSGLDPHISVAYAELQASRIAGERDLRLADVFALIRRYTTGRTLGFMGEPVVNVLELNLALDRS
jgi:K+-transporting ATPase ATPase C chain